MFNFNHPAYRPLWVRLTLVIVVIGWGGVELMTGSPGWAVMFIALGAFLTWSLIINFKANNQ
jgi:hypothetical protein